MGDRVCLIVDDEPVIRKYLRLVLQRIGLQSLEAKDAVEALRILRERGDQINLVITDIKMPGDMDGIDLAYSMQNSFSGLPVILISGFVDKVPAGFTFVRKPFLPDELLEAIEKTMDGSRIRRKDGTDSKVTEMKPASQRSGPVRPPPEAA
jgi:DNA-binding NtrC family response regulator